MRMESKLSPGEYVFATAGLEHGHIYGMTSALLDAGAALKWVWDPDPAKMDAFRAKFPQARPAHREEELLC